MIDPKQLRIGNLLNWEADHVCAGVCMVIDISCFDYEIQSIGGCHPSDEEKKTDVSPIELTPEWLERMGFVKEWYDSDIGVTHEQTMAAQNYGIKPYRYYNWWDGKLSINDSLYYKGREIKPVHQLQNLYFTLL